MMREWLHHFLNPHCRECNRCESCETLKQQLSIANSEKELLFNALIESLPGKEEPPIPTETPKPVNGFTPWRILQGKLEQEARMKNLAETERLRKEQEEQIAKLEKETGISEAEEILESGEGA